MLLTVAGDPFASPEPSPPKVFNTLTVPDNMLFPTALSPPKDTFTPLEIDVLPHHILNRRRLRPRHLHQDFIELLYKPLDPDEKLVPAVAELWEDERRRRVVKGLSLSEKAMMPGSGGMGGRSKAELGYLEEGQTINNKGGDWKISDELWGMIEQRMSDERRESGRVTFERFSAEVKAGRNGEKRKYDKVSTARSIKLICSGSQRLSKRYQRIGLSSPSCVPRPSAPNGLESQSELPRQLLPRPFT